MARMADFWPIARAGQQIFETGEFGPNFRPKREFPKFSPERCGPAIARVALIHNTDLYVLDKSHSAQIEVAHAGRGLAAPADQPVVTARTRRVIEQVSS